MSNDHFAWFYDGPVHTVFLASTTTLSVLSNGLLLYVIFLKTSSSIGQYRYLLAIFSVCDVITSVVHAAIQAIVHMTSTGAIFFPRYGGMMLGGYSIDTLICLLFVVPYYQTFLLLAYHFVYRYRAVVKGHSGSWRTKHWVSLGISIYIVFISVIMAACDIPMAPTNETRMIIAPEIRNVYNIDLTDNSRGFLLIAVQRPDPSDGHLTWDGTTQICLSVLCSMFGGSGSVIVWCIWQILASIKSEDCKLTAQTKKMQLNLFNALLIQSAIPMLFSYLPLGMVLVFPIITGINLGSFGNVLYLITAIFPSIDALFVLYFIGRFRSAVIRIFRPLLCSSPISPANSANVLSVSR